MNHKLLVLSAMLLCCITLCAEEFSDVKIGDLYYTTIAANKVKVVKPTSGKYTGDITIPASVTYNEKTYKVSAIGDYAFQGATGVTSVTLPLTTIESIGGWAFNDCTGLTEFTLPASVTSIEEKAFYYCDNLKDLYVHSPNPASYNPGSMALSKIHYGSHVCTLHVPTGCTAAYAADATFSVFTQVEEFVPPVVASFDLYVAGEQVNVENASDILGDGAASYDAEKKTLTIKGNISSYSEPCISNYIWGLTIEVAEPATLTADYEAIYLVGSTTITGSSLLKLASPKDKAAIRSEGADLTIVDANLTVAGCIKGENSDAVLTITNSSLTIDSEYILGAICYWDDLKLNDCYIKSPVGAYFFEDYVALMGDNTAADYIVISPGVAPTLYDLYVAGEVVTSENASDILGNGAASYDAEKKTLTLKGDISYNSGPCITSNISGLTIEVAKPATLAPYNNEAIYLEASTTITGSSLLKLVSPKDEAAILSDGADLTIVDANLTVAGCINGKYSDAVLTITNSSLTIDSEYYSGAICNWVDLKLNGCYIKSPVGAYFFEDYVALMGDNTAADYIVISPGVAPTLYDLYVAGEVVTSENASDILGNGAASYDAEKKTLTIKGNISSYSKPCISNYISGLTIEVAEPATLTPYHEAIYLEASTTITGSSLLKLVSPEDDAAILSDGADLTIVNANLDVKGSIKGVNTDAVLTITNSSVTIEAEIFSSGAIYNWKDLELNGCYIKWPVGGGFEGGSGCIVDSEGDPANYVIISPGTAPTLYDLYVGGKHVTSENASDILGNGAASYDAEKKTLILKGNISYSSGPCISNNISGLTIEVAEPATLTSDGETLRLGATTTITGSSLLKLVSPIDGAAVISENANLAVVNANLDVKGSIKGVNTDAVLTITNSSVTIETEISSSGAIYNWKDLELNGCYIKSPVGGRFIDGHVAYDGDDEPANYVVIEPKPILKGDANSDGSVTITDAVAIVNYILGNPSGSFNKKAADVNGDDNISITDAVGVVNIILNNP